MKSYELREHFNEQCEIDRGLFYRKCYGIDFGISLIRFVSIIHDAGHLYHFFTHVIETKIEPSMILVRFRSSPVKTSGGRKTSNYFCHSSTSPPNKIRFARMVVLFFIQSILSFKLMIKNV